MIYAKSKHVYLARDRAGVKPLFVAHRTDPWPFASDSRAFHECSEFSPEINLAEVTPFLDHGHVADNECILNTAKRSMLANAEKLISRHAECANTGISLRATAATPNTTTRASIFRLGGGRYRSRSEDPGSKEKN